MMWPVIIIFGFFIFFLLIIYFKKTSRIKRLSANIPSPRSFPIIGSALEFNSGSDGKVLFTELQYNFFSLFF